MSVVFAESTSGSGGGRIKSYYNYSWSYAFRPKSDAVAIKIAYTAELAARRKLVKYKKNNITFYNELKKKGWNIDKVTKKTYAACSQFCSACINAAGVSCKANVNSLMLSSILKKNSHFKTLTGSAISKEKLRKGDILISYHAKGKKHGVVVISSGSLAPKLNSSSTNTSNTSSIVTYSQAYIVKASNVEAVLAKKIITFLSDYELVSQYITLKNIDSIKDMKVMSNKDLLSYYNYLLELLQYLLTYQSTYNSTFIYFLNNDFGFARIDNSELQNFKYYNASIDNKEWVKLYNNLYLKKCALEYYIIASERYVSIFSLPEYLNGLYINLSNVYNNQLGEYLNVLDSYVDENIEMITIADELDIINKTISDLTTKISMTKHDIGVEEPGLLKLKSKLLYYLQIYNNLLQTKSNFKNNNFSDLYNYWNKKIIQEPNLLNFWLDFSNSNEMNNYVVLNVGNKIYYENNESMKMIFSKEIPQIIYYEDDTIKKNKTGYIYLLIPNISSLFKNSNLGVNALDIINNLLYKYSYCIEEKSIAINPIYYLEPNRKIAIYDSTLKTLNDYIINKINYSLAYNTTTSITATKIAEKLY